MDTPPATVKDLEVVFTNVVRVILALGVVGLFWMLITGGFKYLTSGGDPKAVDGAKSTLTYAIGGFIILAFSFLVLQIIASFTGTGSILTEFVISRP